MSESNLYTDPLPQIKFDIDEEPKRIEESPKKVHIEYLSPLLI